MSGLGNCCRGIFRYRDGWGGTCGNFGRKDWIGGFVYVNVHLYGFVFVCMRACMYGCTSLESSLYNVQISSRIMDGTINPNICMKGKK